MPGCRRLSDIDGFCEGVASLLISRPVPSYVCRRAQRRRGRCPWSVQPKAGASCSTRMAATACAVSPSTDSGNRCQRYDSQPAGVTGRKTAAGKTRRPHTEPSAPSNGLLAYLFKKRSYRCCASLMPIVGGRSRCGCGPALRSEGVSRQRHTFSSTASSRRILRERPVNRDVRERI